MRKRHDGMFRLQMRRALESKTVPYVFLTLMTFIVVCFVQSCLMFWGHDQGAVPSAATLWVGNGNRSNANLMTFVTSYLLFPLTSALFADTLFEDRRRATAYLVATRSSSRRYVLAGAACSFFIAFSMTFVVLLLSQAVALIAFPVYASPDAYFVLYDAAPTSNTVFSVLESQPFSELLFSNRYLYNFLYCVYDAVFSGVMALAVYAASLYLRRSRLVLLGLPTMLLLGLSAVAPQGFVVSTFLLPQFGFQGSSEVAVLLAPLFVAVVSLSLIGVPLLLRRDIF